MEYLPFFGFCNFDARSLGSFIRLDLAEPLAHHQTHKTEAMHTHTHTHTLFCLSMGTFLWLDEDDAIVWQDQTDQDSVKTLGPPASLWYENNHGAASWGSGILIQFEGVMMNTRIIQHRV
jgi:hypothetical protein